jgi:glycosyltransferase involved in cell wall biosynthesis
MLQYPKIGFMSQGRSIDRVLLLCCYVRHGVPSVIEMLETVQRLSKYPITVLNLYEHKEQHKFLALPANYDLSLFSCIVIHNTVSYNPDNLFSIDIFLKIKLEEYEGVKILLKQDDFYRFREVSEFIKTKKIDAIFTSTPTEEISKVYQLNNVPSNFEVLHMLTGYITPHMRELHYSNKRSIDIGYRGSIMPLSFGRLCYEKRKIGDDVSRLLSNRQGVHLDISSKWEDRLGGANWFDFLKKCKTVLGVESGSGVFDLDGSLSAKCIEIENKIGAFRLDHKYAEEYLRELGEYEGNVKYFMISPRHFEAISCGAVQILFPGRYTDRMKAGKHYFELRRDYANIDEIFDLLSDEKLRNEMATRAFEEVNLDKRNWIESFVEKLDKTIEKQLELKGASVHKNFFAVSEKKKANVLLIQAHEHGLDPRRDQWIPKNSGADLLISQLVIDRSLSTMNIRKTDYGSLVISLPFISASNSSFINYGPLLGVLNPIVNLLSQLSYIISCSNNDFAKYVGAPVNSPRINYLKSSIKYVLDTTASLLEGLRGIRGINTIIAINLPTLFSAVITKELHNIPIVYDALEYWPEIDPDSEQFEIDFWIALERQLLRNVDSCNTVTPGLADIMKQNYKMEFGVLPNCCPLDEHVGGVKLGGRSNHYRFIYQGSYAPHRCLEELIRAFSNTDVNALLYLRGIENDFKYHLIRVAKDEGVYNTKVFFMPSVSSVDLVRALHQDGDIGIVPYKPIGENYRNCSPNKLGQYFAAGMPILANKTNYVADIIEKSGAGVVVNFSDHQELILAIQKICADSNRFSEYAKKSTEYFLRYFNWDNLSKDYYNKLATLVASTSAGRDEPSRLIIYKDESKTEDQANFNSYPSNFTSKYNKKTKQLFIYTWSKLPNSLKNFLKPKIKYILGKLGI